MTIFISVLVWLLITVVCAFVLCKEEGDGWTIALIFPVIIFLLLFITDGLASFNACKTANFYKTHYNMEYTPHEIFWNGAQIERQIIGDKNRIELEVK